MLRREQDEQLDGLHDAIVRLGDLSMHISREVEEQGVMMREVEEEMDETNEAMEATTRRIKEFIDSNGGPRWCCLATALTVIALFLLFLIILGA